MHTMEYYVSHCRHHVTSGTCRSLRHAGGSAPCMPSVIGQTSPVLLVSPPPRLSTLSRKNIYSTTYPSPFAPSSIQKSRWPPDTSHELEPKACLILLSTARYAESCLLGPSPTTQHAALAPCRRQKHLSPVRLSPLTLLLLCLSAHHGPATTTPTTPAPVAAAHSGTILARPHGHRHAATQNGASMPSTTRFSPRH